MWRRGRIGVSWGMGEWTGGRQDTDTVGGWRCGSKQGTDTDWEVRIRKGAPCERGVGRRKGGRGEEVWLGYKDRMVHERLPLVSSMDGKVHGAICLRRMACCSIAYLVMSSGRACISEGIDFGCRAGGRSSSFVCLARASQRQASAYHSRRGSVLALRGGNGVKCVRVPVRLGAVT